MVRFFLLFGPYNKLISNIRESVRHPNWDVTSSTINSSHAILSPVFLFCFFSCALLRDWDQRKMLAWTKFKLYTLVEFLRGATEIAEMSTLCRFFFQWSPHLEHQGEANCCDFYLWELFQSPVSVFFLVKCWRLDSFIFFTNSGIKLCQW